MAYRHSCWLACAGVAALLSGCVERRFVVNSELMGAKVYVNNRPVGFTPVDVPFTYYGKYLITLELPGHQTKHVEEHIDAPIYYYPPSDFVLENLYPGKLSDIRRLDYVMEPMPRPNLDDLRMQAEDLRQRGRELPEPTIPNPQRPSDPVIRPNPPRNGNGPPLLDPVP